jgi:hypothetical protein
MQAAVLYEPNTPLRIEEFELPELGPQHVPVRLMASGVCHSDWHIVKGEWPHIPIPSIPATRAPASSRRSAARSATSPRAPRRPVLEAQLRPG